MLPFRTKGPPCRTSPQGVREVSECQRGREFNKYLTNVKLFIIIRAILLLYDLPNCDAPLGVEAEPSPSRTVYCRTLPIRSASTKGVFLPGSHVIFPYYLAASYPRKPCGNSGGCEPGAGGRRPRHPPFGQIEIPPPGYVVRARNVLRAGAEWGRKNLGRSYL